MSEQIAQANGIEIAFETFGSPDDPAVLLIMGLGAHLIHWEPEFCTMLADRGYHVIRFDNRDVGHSTKMEDAPVPNIGALLSGDVTSASYTLDDMANDAIGLLDYLEIDRAHLVGASMGGMIAQTIAVRHAARVLSLVSIMSTTGDRSVGQALPHALAVLMTPPPEDRAKYIDFHVNAFKTIGSPGFDIDEDFLRQRGAATYDRSFYPVGVARQLAAIIASGDRTPSLAEISVPTVVIHGRDDPLIQVSGGEATARAIPDAELVVIPGMGHDVPRGVWERIVEAIVANAERAEARSL
jgi:pimeloyl-ACP methyl ester carboxylesterase